MSDGDLAGARESLRSYPADTAFQRYWREADAWFLDRLEGGSEGTWRRSRPR